MTVDTAVKPMARKPHTNANIAIKPGQKQWIVEIRNTRHEAKAGVNSLVDAAAIIFTTATELKHTHKPSTAASLQQRLIKEIREYQAEIQKHQYENDVVLASRYCLCATLDEIIMNTAWGAHDYWDGHTLQAKLHHDTALGKRFFAILQRVQQEAVQHIDLLELMYLCMSMGFKGPYRNTLYGSSQLNQIMEQLYRQIRDVRGEFSKTLSPNLPQVISAPAAQKESFVHHSLFTIGLTFLVIAIIASSFSYLFKLTSQQLFQGIAQTSTVEVNDDQATR